MRRAATISGAVLGSIGAALLLYHALANFLTVGPAHLDRPQRSAAYPIHESSSNAAGESSPSEPRTLEEKQ